MSFTNNRVDFFEKESYTEKLHAFALVKGMENCVPQGLELTGNTLSNGYFANGGALGQLGNDGETHTITTNYTGFIVIKTTFNGVNSKSEIVESGTLLSTPLGDKGAIKYFTIYELSNGTIINDFRNRKYIKSIEVISNGDDTFTIKINDKASNQFSTSVLQNAWTKSEADGRFKRIIDINSEFVDSEFAGMNMAQIMKYITDFVGNWGHTYEIVAECTNSTFPNVRDAMRSMVNEIFETNIMTSTLKFKVNRPRRSGLGGGDIIEVGFDNSPIYYVQYDNYGVNWATLNADAFEPAKKIYGTLRVEEISSQDGTTNVKNNLKLDGTLYCDGQTRVLGGDLLTPFFHESSLTAVADETTLVKQNYGNGNTSMTLGNLKAVSSERTFTNLTKYDTTGSANRAILIFSSTASDAGVIHQVGDTNHKLAYNSDITRTALQKDNEYLPVLIEMQKSIDSIQGLRSESDLLTTLKLKQTKAESDLVELEKQDKINSTEEDLLQLKTELSDVENIITESKQHEARKNVVILEQKANELQYQITVKELELATIKEG